MKLHRLRLLLATSAVSAFSLVACSHAPDAASSRESATSSALALAADGGATSVTRPYEDRLNQGFGAGYNPITGLSPTVDCALTDEAARCEGGDCKEKWTFRVEPVSGNQELLDKLGVSSAGRADFSSTARLAKTRFASLTTMDAYQVGILVSARHTVRELSVPAGSRSLNPDYEQLLADDPGAFATACGSELPLTLVDGDEFFALFPVRSDSEVALAWVREQLTALSRSWEVRVNAKPNDPREAARERAEWQAYQYGIAPVLQTIKQVARSRGYSLSRIAGKTAADEVQGSILSEELKTTLDSFGIRPTEVQPLILDGTFARYDKVLPGLEGFASSFDWSVDEAKLQEQSTALLGVEDALASARYIPQVPVLFPNVDSATIERRQERLVGFETSLKADLTACVTTRSACATLAAPSNMRVIERLPAYPPPVRVSTNFCTGGQSCFVGVSPSPEFPRGALVSMDGTTSAGLLGRFTSLALTREGTVQTGAVFDIQEKYKAYCSASRPERTCSFADMNGDGSPDLVSAGGASAGTRVYPFAPGAAGLESLGASKGWGHAADGIGTSYAQRVADVSGDGLADVVTFDGKGAAYVALSDGARLKPGTSWITGFGGPGYTFLVSDVNGDRRADLVGVAEDGTSILALSTGTGFAAPVPSGAVGCHVVTACKPPACLPERCELVDVNGDNRADVVAIHRDGRVTAAFGGGEGFQAPKLWTDGFCRSGEPDCLVADMNGDGRADLVSFVKSSVAGDPETTAAGDVHVVYAPGYSQR